MQFSEISTAVKVTVYTFQLLAPGEPLLRTEVGRCYHTPCPATRRYLWSDIMKNTGLARFAQRTSRTVTLAWTNRP